MDIFIYLVLQANLPEIKGHIAYINAFLRNELLKSTKGYYFATLEAAVEFIEEMHTRRSEQI
jgi:hypothetical protein